MSDFSKEPPFITFKFGKVKEDKTVEPTEIPPSGMKRRAS